MQYSKHDIESWERQDAADEESMTPEERLNTAFQLFDFYRDTMLGVLHARFPDASDSEIDRLFLAMLDDHEGGRAAA